MLGPGHKDRTRQWPFWLLLLAWLFASCPVHVTGAVINWIGEAHSFSHQKRLTLQVARLLVGEKLPAGWTAGEERPTPSPKPALPPGDSVKKSDLATEETIESRRPRLVEIALVPAPTFLRGELRAAPLHGPPRVAVVS